jgi:hypothetical protein
LRLVDVQGLDLHGVLTARPAEAEAVPSHRFDVRGPLVDERDVFSRTREHPADDAADGAGANDRDSHGSLRGSRSRGRIPSSSVGPRLLEDDAVADGDPSAAHDVAVERHATVDVPHE